MDNALPVMPEVSMHAFSSLSLLVAWSSLLLSALASPALAEDVSEISVSGPSVQAVASRLEPAEQLASAASWMEAPAALELGTDEEALDATGQVFELEVGEARLASGVLLPVWHGTPEDAEADGVRIPRRMVAVVFVGEGNLALRPTDRGLARGLANRLVRRERIERAAGAAFLAGEPLTVGMDQMVLSDAGRLAPRLADGSRLTVEQLEAHRGDLRKAREVWRSQGGSSRRPGLDTSLRLERLRMEGLGAPAETARATASVRTDFPLGDALGESGVSADDRWMTVLIDPRGIRNTHYRAYAASRDRDSYGRWLLSELGGVVFPPRDPTDPRSGPFPQVHLEPGEAETTVRTLVSDDGLYMDTEVESHITLTVRGAPQQLVQLRLPIVEARDDSFSLLEVLSDDGMPITWLSLEDTTARQLAATGLPLLLPEPAQPGQEIGFTIRWRDSWPYANLADVSNRSYSSGLQQVIPSPLPMGIGNPWRFVTRLGRPTGSDLSVALSGDTLRRWEEDGWTWEEAGLTDQTALWANVAVGRWIEVEEAAAEGMPAVRVHLFPSERGSIETFPAEIRRELSFFQQFLPPYPYGELEIFQAPTRWFGYVWIAAQGLINLQKTRMAGDVRTQGAMRQRTPHMEHGVLSHELAHQYWGHMVRPASTRDFWLAETLAEAYSCLYVGAAFGPAAFAERMELYRELWEEELPDFANASLTAAYSSPFQPHIVYKYGPFVFHRILRPMIGEQAFFGAMDQLQIHNAPGSVSTAQLKHAFEQTSGQDLTHFFDFWVDGGFLPELEASWATTGSGGATRITGTLAADVPFGTFRVPIRITAGGGDPQDLWVDVVDGTGTFETEPVGGGRIRLEVDPDGQILARSRKSSRIR